MRNPFTERAARQLLTAGAAATLALTTSSCGSSDEADSGAVRASEITFMTKQMCDELADPAKDYFTGVGLEVTHASFSLDGNEDGGWCRIGGSDTTGPTLTVGAGKPGYVDFANFAEFINSEWVTSNNYGTPREVLSPGWSLGAELPRTSGSVTDFWLVGSDQSALRCYGSSAEADPVPPDADAVRAFCDQAKAALVPSTN